MPGPVFTVAVPTHNRDFLLGRAIACILAQKFTDFELLISDNASTDQTEKVVQTFSDPRIRYFRQETDVGPLPNYDFTIREARGKYWIGVSDDDVLSDLFLQRAFEGFSQYPEAKAFTCNFIEAPVRRFFSGCKFIGILPDPNFPLSVTLIGPEVTLPLMLFHNPFGSSATCVETQLMRELAPFDERYITCPDRVMWAKVALKTHFIIDGLPLVVFSKHKDNFSGKGDYLKGRAQGMKDATRFIWDTAVATGLDLKTHLARLTDMMPEDDVRMFAAPACWTAYMPETDSALRAMIRRVFPEGVPDVMLRGQSFLNEKSITVVNWRDLSLLKCLKCNHTWSPSTTGEPAADAWWKCPKGCN